MINFSSKENIEQTIELERISLMSNLDIQKNLNKQILMFMKNFMSSIDFSYDASPADSNNTYLNELTSKLNFSNSNINTLKKLIETLDNIDISSETLENDIQKYNDIFKETFDFVYTNTDNIEKFLYKTHLSDSPEAITEEENVDFEDLKELGKKQLQHASTDKSEILQDSTNKISADSKTQANTNRHINTSNAHYIENTLIISETRGKVILPYTISAVQEIFSQNNDIYLSLKDVIDKVFTLPIDYYHFSPIARFKEAFKLVRYKEKGSKVKALALAFELFVNYNLHPAIITACNSLDELDIYLACLEENNLQDFHFFNIIYEIPLATYNPKHSL